MITKGKWKVEPPANEGIGARIIIDGNGSVVATVNAEANAQLIALSPRMAEWLAKVAKQDFVVFPKDKKLAREIIQTLDS